MCRQVLHVILFSFNQATWNMLNSVYSAFQARQVVYSSLARPLKNTTPWTIFRSVSNCTCSLGCCVVSGFATLQLRFHLQVYKLKSCYVTSLHILGLEYEGISKSFRTESITKQQQ